MALPIALSKQQEHLKLRQCVYCTWRPKEWAGEGMVLRRPTISPQCRGCWVMCLSGSQVFNGWCFSVIFWRAFLFLLFNVLLLNSYNMSRNTFTTWKFQKFFWLSILTQACQEKSRFTIWICFCCTLLIYYWHMSNAVFWLSCSLLFLSKNIILH